MSSVQWEPEGSPRLFGPTVRIPTASRSIVARILERPQIVLLHWSPTSREENCRGRSLPCLGKECLFCRNGSEAFPYGYSPAQEFDRIAKRWNKFVLGLCRSFLRVLDGLGDYVGKPIHFRVERPHLKPLQYKAEFAAFQLPKPDPIPPFDVRPQLEALWGHYAKGIQLPTSSGPGREGLSA